MLYNAVYLAIFISFVRKVLNKLMIPMEVSIRKETRKHTDEYYVCVCGEPVFWSEDPDEANAFCFACIARDRGLAQKLSVIENDDMLLHAAESIVGLSPDEVDAVNATVDDFDDIIS